MLPAVLLQLDYFVQSKVLNICNIQPIVKRILKWKASYYNTFVCLSSLVSYNWKIALDGTRFSADRPPTTAAITKVIYCSFCSAFALFDET